MTEMIRNDNTTIVPSIAFMCDGSRERIYGSDKQSVSKKSGAVLLWSQVFVIAIWRD